MEENRPEEQKALRPDRPAYSTKTWRACCLAPTIAIAVIFVLTIAAGLYGPQPRLLRRPQPPVQGEANQQRREAFVQFGKVFFATAARADRLNQAAFQELNAYTRGSGSIEGVHAIFAKASSANSRAAAEFRKLAIPSGLQSQPKLRRSLDMMSESYNARRQACETILGWNGDLQDRVTADRYRQQAYEINQLTMQGLRLLGEAADDNGLTKDDSEKFIPPSTTKVGIFDAGAMLPD